MSVLTALRDRVSTTESSAGRADDAERAPGAEAGLPFAGYDRLGARQVIDGLHDHSQVELAGGRGLRAVSSGARGRARQAALDARSRAAARLRRSQRRGDRDRARRGRSRDDQEGPQLRAQVRQPARRPGRGRPRTPSTAGRATRQRRARLSAAERDEEPLSRERLPSSADVEHKSLTSLWTRYAGTPPTEARTEIRGNVVTCVLVDGVDAFNQRMIAPQTRDNARCAGRLTPAAYKREAVAAVVRADPPARSLVCEQPRPRHRCRHRDLHPGAFLRHGIAPRRAAIRKRLVTPAAGLTETPTMDFWRQPGASPARARG